MKWIRKAWRSVRRWLLRLPKPLGAVRVHELPKDLNARSIYVVGENGYLWFAAMRCPCGCGATLHMSLLPKGQPRWEVTEHDDGTITLHPSIWRTVGCRSHFFLRKGLVEWVPKQR